MPQLCPWGIEGTRPASRGRPNSGFVIPEPGSLSTPAPGGSPHLATLGLWMVWPCTRCPWRSEGGCLSGRRPRGQGAQEKGPGWRRGWKHQRRRRRPWEERGQEQPGSKVLWAAARTATEAHGREAAEGLQTAPGVSGGRRIRWRNAWRPAVWTGLLGNGAQRKPVRGREQRGLLRREEEGGEDRAVDPVLADRGGSAHGHGPPLLSVAEGLVARAVKSTLSDTLRGGLAAREQLTCERFPLASASG